MFDMTQPIQMEVIIGSIVFIFGLVGIGLAVVEYYNNFGNKPLLTSNNISRELNNIIVYGLNETEVFRLLIHNCMTLQEAKKYGITRGTDLITIEKHYTSI